MQRSDVQCLHRWQKVLNPDLVKGPWTPEVRAAKRARRMPGRMNGVSAVERAALGPQPRCDGPHRYSHCYLLTRNGTPPAGG